MPTKKIVVDDNRRLTLDNDTWPTQGGPWNIPKGFTSKYRCMMSLIRIAGLREEKYQ